MRVVRTLAAAGVGSLLHHDEDTWHDWARSTINDTRSRGFLSYASRVIADLAEAGGWDAEYPRDVWRMRRLGYDGDRTLRFDGIPQPWLRDLAKRWVRWRLSTGLGLEAGGGRPVVALTRFAGFLSDIGVESIDPDQPAGAGTLSGQPAQRLHRCPTPRDPHRAAQPILRRCPPTPLGHRSSRRRDVLRRGLPQTRRTVASGTGRTGHDPARGSEQPRPIRRPCSPVDHDHLDALRATDHPMRCGYAAIVWSPTPKAHRICATSTAR